MRNESLNRDDIAMRAVMRAIGLLIEMEPRSLLYAEERAYLEGILDSYELGVPLRANVAEKIISIMKKVASR